MNQKILVPLDGSNGSMRALDAALDLARSLHAEVLLAHVIDSAKAARLSFGEPALIDGCYDALRDDGKRILAEALARTRLAAANVSTILAYGNPTEELERIAVQANATMIVIGSHGRTGLSRLVMGSVAEGVVRIASVPVMVVPPERHPESRERTVA
ncbi:MAG TPA: universal stress protein [Candidatus Tyrphobacter sp.]